MAESIYKSVRKEHDMTRDEVCDAATDLGTIRLYYQNLHLAIQQNH